MWLIFIVTIVAVVLALGLAVWICTMLYISAEKKLKKARKELEEEAEARLKHSWVTVQGAGTVVTDR